MKRGKTGNHGKVGVEKLRKWWILAQPPFSPQETEGSYPGWNYGIREIYHLTRRRTQGVGIVKGWEDKRDRARIPDTFTKNKNNTSVGPLTPPTPFNE